MKIQNSILLIFLCDNYIFTIYYLIYLFHVRLFIKIEYVGESMLVSRVRFY